jgi:hypothetical protein
MQRLKFDISGTTAAFTDTGPGVNGAILQMRWYPTVVDTGGDLRVDLLVDERDTGKSIVVYNDNDCLGAAFTRVPTQPQNHPDGADTGASSDVPFVAAGERLRVTITPGGTSIAGQLYVWVLPG